MLSSRLFLLASLGLSVVACTSNASDDTATSGDNELNEAPTPRKGSSISSPSVDPSKMYWGARTIGYLQTVGYLSAAEASVANRADGILANSPPNGKIGVDELAALESPAHINTLFPAEKAVIPKLWAMLVIDDVTNYSPTSLSIAPTVHDAYSATPFQAPIAKLDAQYTQLASRIELTQNSDGDATTISGSDIEKAYGDKTSYLPAEITELRQIQAQIAKLAPQLGDDAQYVSVPAGSTSSLANFTPVQLMADSTIGIGGMWNGSNLATAPALSASSILYLTNTDTATLLITIDKTSGQDYLVQGVQTHQTVGTSERVEIWKGGTRGTEFDATPGAGASNAIPFGYAVVIGTTKYVLNCAPNGCSYSTQLASLPPMAPTSYYVSGHTDYRLDVFQNGRALLVGGGSTATCYPMLSNYQTVPGCNVWSAAGQVAVQMTYNALNADSPALVAGRFTTPAFGSESLYTY